MAKDIIHRYELDIKAKPKAIDIVNWKDDGPGASWHGIYQFDGDELMICYDVGLKKKERPSAFESNPKTDTVLIKLKREKP